MKRKPVGFAVYGINAKILKIFILQKYCVLIQLGLTEKS